MPFSQYSLKNNTFKRSCHFEFLLNQFCSVLLLTCSLLCSLLLVIALISVHKLCCRNLRQFPRVQRNCFIQRQFYGRRKKRFLGTIKGNEHFNYHNFLNFFNTHLNLVTVNFLAKVNREEKPDSKKIDDYSHSPTKADLSVGFD